MELEQGDALNVENIIATILVEAMTCVKDAEDQWVDLENGEWCPQSWQRPGDLKELQGLFDKSILEPVVEIPPGARLIIRKEGTVKNRLLLCDVAYAKAIGGEMFGTTPSLHGLRVVLTVASWRRNQDPGWSHGTIAGDVSLSFPHAAIDALIATRIPDSLQGLQVRIHGRARILQAKEAMMVRKAPTGIEGHQNCGSNFWWR